MGVMRMGLISCRGWDKNGVMITSRLSEETSMCMLSLPLKTLQMVQ